ncbi:MAG: hypothetical protein EOM23_08365 [Candidatus Moranbacteria bacterium]|nr:hypothetical protein [Candidatus Moranbacteria bacterium]
MQIEGEKKWLKRLDFVANETKDVKEKFDKAMSQMSLLIKENSVKDEQIQVLSNLVVQTLSVSNIPVAQKEKFYNSLNSISVVSENTTQVLKGVIEQTKTLETQRQSNLNSSLEKLRNEV